MFWSVQLYNFVLLHITYINISLYFYLGYTLITLLLPLVSMIVARILLGFLVVIHNNSELIKTIKKILEVFPEGIVIQSLDKRSQELVVQFANDAAAKDVINYDGVQGWPIDSSKLNYEIKYESDSGNLSLVQKDNPSLSTVCLSKFLAQQVEVVQNNDKEVSVPVEFISKDSDKDSTKSKFYIVKTLKVKWIHSKDSFIHVFVNATTIKKFEKEKARNEWLQLMFSSVSHEFRTPINAFMNSIQFLESNYQTIITKLSKWVDSSITQEVLTEQLKESNEKFFKIWKISSSSLMWLVEDILDLAKIEAGTFSLNEQPFTVSSLVKEIEYIFAFLWAHKGITFKIEADRELLESIFWSDMGRIKQVIINLISNACKFTLEGSVTLQIKSAFDFDPANFERCRYLKFKVIDTGIGIHQKEIPKLFKLFGTVNQHHNNINSRGTGLGLSISKKIVDSLKGSIQLKSQIDKGTKVKFTVKEKLKDSTRKLSKSTPLF